MVTSSAMCGYNLMARVVQLLLTVSLLLIDSTRFTRAEFRVLSGPGRGAPSDDPLLCYTDGGRQGDCRPWRYCRVVRDEYPQKKPTICLYRPKDPIVCCPRRNNGDFITTPRPIVFVDRPSSSSSSGGGGGWRPLVRPPRPRPTRRPDRRPVWQPSGQFVTASGRPGQFVTTQRPAAPPDHRPGHFVTTQRPAPAAHLTSPDQAKHTNYIGHKECGLVTPTIRADYNQLELRRRRRRRALDRSHASPPTLDRSHASPPDSADTRFAFFDSLDFDPSEYDEDFKPYTELPPPAEEETGLLEEGAKSPVESATAERGQGDRSILRVTVLPPEGDAAGLLYGDAEEGYDPDSGDPPPEAFNTTFNISVGGAEDDPYGIFSQEYGDRVSSLLSEAQYITGGTDAIIGRWPWITLIGEQRPNRISWFCGGALLNERFVATAAHCLGKFQKNRLLVRVGDFDLNYDTDAPHQDLLVDRIYLHPKYQHRRKHHDLALLRLSSRTPAVLGPLVRPVCLPRPGVDLTGRLGTVAGWGHTEFGGESSAVLQEVRLPMVDTGKCEAKYRTLGDMFDLDFAPGFGNTKICAHDTAGTGKDACQGDSGGPMTYRDPASGRVQLVGVVSTGVGCGHPGFPGIYTRVAMYVDWILEKAFN